MPNETQTSPDAGAEVSLPAEEIAPGEAWANSPFGASMTGDDERKETAQPGVAPELKDIVDDPNLVEEPAIADNTPDEKSAWQLKNERLEAVREAHLAVKLDRDRIARILDDNPHLLPEGENTFDEKKEAKELQARRQDLQKTLDAISQLPETLDFQPGITLIVGENGIGKSTLAHALQLAVDIKQRELDETSDHTRASAIDMVLKPAGYSLGDKNLDTFAPYIAKLVDVTELQSGRQYIEYHDSALSVGAVNAHRQNLDFNGPPGTKRPTYEDTDLRRGGSHRQTVDQLFEYIARDKKEYQRRLAGKRYALTVGPHVYFIDEPEVGMSPKRHRNIEQELDNVLIENSVAILPTNSVVLYETDLPRIDLEHPERGIFRPSEYPE